MEPTEALDLDRATEVSLPWNHLKKGPNTFSIAGPNEALQHGVSVMGRVHEASSGYHVFQTDETWATARGPVCVLADRSPAPQPADNGPRRSIEMRRSFDLPQVPATARLHATGLGCYELSINGRRVGDELLSPGWTDYRQRLQYTSHDITPLLRRGSNTITALIGNGWWSSGMGWESRGKSAEAGQSYRLLLDVTGSDRAEAKRLTASLVSTDKHWEWRPSSILRDTIYHGQTEDLRDNVAPWKTVLPLDDGYQPALQPGAAEPIRVTDELVAQSILKLRSGEWLVDFGQNHAGRPRLKMALPSGTTLRIRYCEELDESGNPYYENYRTAAATDRIIAGEKPIDWSPAFTYRGYRYAVVSGLPEGFEPTPQMLRSQVIHNDVASASTFRCNNGLLNQIDQMVRWGLRSNLHSVPTDCPQRDERLGWSGDVQLFARTSCWMNGLQNFYRKWLTDLIDTQDKNGGLMHTAPFMEEILPVESFPVWADVITVLPAIMHEFYGDRDLLKRTYGPMKRWLGWLETQAVEDLCLVGGFGDWVPVEETPPEVCGAAYYAHSSRIVARVAKTLGHEQDAQRFHAQADRAAMAYHRHFFDDNEGQYTPNTQTAQLMPLAFDLTPPKLRQQVANRLAEMVEERGAKPSTGFVGTSLLLPVLTRFGHHELAYRTLNTREYPSLGYMIDHNATTVWERWNSDKVGPDMNSRNHFCLGSMAQWLYEDLVGIRPDPGAAGFRKVLLSPRPVGDLRFTEFTYVSPYGEIKVRWSIKHNVLTYEVTLPSNTSAELRLPTTDPAACRTLGLSAHITSAGQRPAQVTPLGTFAVYELPAGRHTLSTPIATVPDVLTTA